MQPSNTRLLLRVQSRYLTRASRCGSNFSVTFQTECPSEFSSALCQPGPRSGSGMEVAEQSMYAVLDLSLAAEKQRGPVQVELEAHNNVTEASLSVAVHLEEPLTGLVVQPHPARRVLMESLVVSSCVHLTDAASCLTVYTRTTLPFVRQSYTASVLGGSSPTFKWTVDDKPYFTYYNTVLNVIYQHAAVYKLTVSSSHPNTFMYQTFFGFLMLFSTIHGKMAVTCFTFSPGDGDEPHQLAHRALQCDGGPAAAHEQPHCERGP